MKPLRNFAFFIVICLVFIQGGSVIADKKIGDTWTKKVSLADLMIDSDIIIVGTVTEVSRSEGNYYITAIEVRKIIASVWSHEETQKCMVRENEYHNKVYMVKKLPFSDGDVMAPILLRGGEFLLWLKRFEISQEEASKVGIESFASYSTVAGWKGAILLSDSHKLTDYALIKKMKGNDFEPYADQKELLKNSFDIMDPAMLLIATEKFAAALMDDASTEELLEQIEANKELIYSSTADQLLKVIKARKLRKFRFLGINE